MNTMLFELCSVSAIAISDKKYHDELKSFYRTALLDKTEDSSENEIVPKSKGLEGPEAFAGFANMVTYGR